MASNSSVPSTPVAAILFREVARYPNQPTVNHPGDNANSSRMGDEGCPNESASLDDATGYSREEEEVESTTGEEAS
jgi:hypothetical protein